MSILKFFIKIIKRNLGAKFIIALFRLPFNFYFLLDSLNFFGAFYLIHYFN
nr:MAG TPA: hypothetical protein [Caudoviricetes sp.]